MSAQKHIILLVEDSPDDVFFMRYALKKAQLEHPLHVATDGEEAIAYLSGTGKYSNREVFPFPTVVFLDLKLPCLSGFEVLAWLRAQPALSETPVFILTGSSEERDRQRARELGVMAYYVKPPDEAMLRQATEMLNARSAPAQSPGLAGQCR